MDYIIVIQGIIIIILLVILLFKKEKSTDDSKQKEIVAYIQNIQSDMTKEAKNNRIETNENTMQAMRQVASIITENQMSANNLQSEKIASLESTVDKMLKGIDLRMSSFTTENEQKLENIRNTISVSLKDMQDENAKKLDEMRSTVDEKLQKTLEDRISQSFKIVSERLEQVYKGLGEMQTLANGVGDLKKVLSNVKTRGILGEIQLEAILEQILSPEQYEKNIATIKGSKNVVEFAIKLPGDDDGVVYLPIDSKFPGETYSQLVDAYESGKADEIERCLKNLDKVIKSSAKDIRDKYIETPYTTEFGIMFLPFEGLYAEVVRRGLLETLQRDYKVNIAGPTTIAALLNSLQMGFRTLAIQKRSSEVWNVLGAVKSEFDKFEGVLSITQNKLEQVSKELDKLVGVRTRQINRKLRDITSISDDEAIKLIASDEE